MDRTASVAHATHDELLIARLYGGDVDSAERARALELVADCRDCADLFADLGVIADADAAMQVPLRPRDFSLTEADAARLRRRRPAAWFFGAGLRRSLGGSLAALGLVGVVLTGVASITGGAASPVRFTNQSLTGGAPVAAPATGVDSAAFGALPTAAPAASQASELAAATPASTAAGGSPAPAATAYAQVAASPAASLGAPTVAPQDQNKASLPSEQPGGTGQPTPAVPESSVAQGGVDARILWLAGFGALFFLGVAIAILPWRSRRRGRGDPS